MSIDRAIDRLNAAGRTDLAEAVSDLMRSAERLALERAEFRRDAEKWEQKAEHWMAAYVAALETLNAKAAQSAGEKPRASQLPMKPPPYQPPPTVAVGAAERIRDRLQALDALEGLARSGYGPTFTQCAVHAGGEVHTFGPGGEAFASAILRTAGAARLHVRERIAATDATRVFRAPT